MTAPARRGADSASEAVSSQSNATLAAFIAVRNAGEFTRMKNYRFVRD
jgi:hypothetical protein